MKTQNTPGPWSRNIKPASKYPTVFAGRNTHVAVACTRGLSEAEIEGNVSLIASAPKLLDALQRIYAALPVTASPQEFIDGGGNWGLTESEHTVALIAADVLTSLHVRELVEEKV